MKIIVRAFGLVGETIKETFIEGKEDSFLEDLLVEMAKRYGEDFRGQIFDPSTKQIREGIGMTLNGRFIGNNEIATTRLREGDRLAFFILVAGGYE